MVLIFNASPREKGDTAYLIGELTRELDGEIHIVNTYRENISPCTDCRFCWEHPGCCIRDGMEPVYGWIQEADWIVLCSPIHFDEVSGSLLQTASRLQPFWMAQQKRGEALLRQKTRHGAAILVGGCTRPADDAHRMCRRLLHCMGAECETILHARDTDHLPVQENLPILEQVHALAARIGAKNGSSR